MYRHRPHHLAPHPATARVLIAYKNFAASKNVSHIGLGVAALNTSRTLRALGYWAEVVPATSAAGLEEALVRYQAAAHRDGIQPVSHVVISAPWIATADLAGLLMRHPDVHFTVVSHSNVGFLMADPSGIRLLREGTELAVGHHNFAVGGNCSKFVQAWGVMYGVHLRWLPNLYDVSTLKPIGQRPPWTGGPLRMGVFGATRPLKNQVTAVAACVELSARLRADVEVWTSSGRNEGGGTVDGAIQQLVAGLDHVRLRPTGWRPWPAFRQVVGRMHILLNPSYTESFNMVCADGVAEGVASVASEAIDWVPHSWRANVDDVEDVARVARRLVTDAHAVDEGQAALREYVDRGSRQWRAYLGGER